jgi:phage terminase small subunit
MPTTKHQQTDKVIVKKFASEFVKSGGNATQAALATKPNKYATARMMGYKLMKRDDVKEAINEAMASQEITIEWLLTQRKQLIEKGMDQVNNGFIPYKLDKDGKKITNNVEISPSDIDKNLQGIERMISILGGSNSNDVPNASSHIHLHLEQATVSEVIAKRNELSGWFGEILEGEKID